MTFMLKTGFPSFEVITLLWKFLRGLLHTLMVFRVFLHMECC